MDNQRREGNEMENKSSALPVVRPLPPQPQLNPVDDDDVSLSPSSTEFSSNQHLLMNQTLALQQQPLQPVPAPRLTPASRSRSIPYVPSPLNPNSLTGPEQPVTWRKPGAATSSPLPIPPPPPGASGPSPPSGASSSSSTSRPPSMNFQRFASEDDEALTVPLRRSQPPSSTSRPASMVLYRLASDEDRVDFGRPHSMASLNPPSTSFRPASVSRFSTISQSPSVFSLSSDSKYPVFGTNPFEPLPSPALPFSQGYGSNSRSSSPNGSIHNGGGTPPSPTGASQGAFLPYEYDPSTDQDAPPDDDDALHEPDPKGARVRTGSIFNLRGIPNIFCLVFLVLGLLALFVVGPIINHLNLQAAAAAASTGGAVTVGPVGPATTADAATDVIPDVTSEISSALASSSSVSVRPSSSTRSRATPTLTATATDEEDPSSTAEALIALTTTSRAVATKDIAAPAKRTMKAVMKKRRVGQRR